MSSLSRAIAKLNKLTRACVWKVFLLFVGDRRQPTPNPSQEGKTGDRRNGSGARR
ncbi:MULTISPECIES: hypothetical protein [unclassified Okeania]|uniref:hypothetical protein n=1 Tax=unclassified Okeania TaxID=2634635 RepID=UPI0013B8AE41|nr:MULTISPECIES: hypothetical protein [unclassified Okeania]NES75876.1 hypothetical protein [Okeania sp. SIO1H4]NET18993.1 hypothetical protein [Okeania sp. SIO1H5]NET77994.1 hypothetical protein [Okeania sp. SIO1F9]NET96125.1 hypothetical protein [Okeania sp. SIO1H2]